MGRSRVYILMRALLACAAILGLSACGGAKTAPVDIAEVRTALDHAIKVIATGIEREDAVLASQPVSERFVMGNNVAVRYLDGGWSGEGIGKFRTFFDSVFEIHSNISQTFEVRDVNQVGDVAAVRVYNELVSSRVDRTPPENSTAAGWDWFIFERDSGQWLLIGWDEAPEPAPEPEPEPEPEPDSHDEGEGGDL